MAKNIGATLSLKDGNFFTGIKSAAAATAGLKDELSDTRKKISDFGSGLKDLAVKAAGVMATVGTAAMGVAGAALNIGTEYKTALNGISAQTGVSKEKLESLNGVLKDIYSENYGESFQDIADAISTVTNNADNIDTSSIKQFTTDAIALRDTFGYDIQESVNSANMLIKQFGMSGTEAFNLIAQGTQLGLNKNGDFLDTINEYSVHFKQIGISAEGMFNAIANGTANGAFSVDKLGDAVKEFGIRVKDGTGDEAFQALGLSAEEMKKAFVSGGAAGEQAFKSVTNALFSMDDKVQQNLLGVQLFGTMWEDLGVEGVKALSDLDGEFNRVHDTMSEIKNIKYDDLGSAFEGLKRLLTVKLLLPISEELTPAVSDFINNLRASFEDGALSGAVTALSTGIVSGLRGIGGVAKNVFSAFSTAIENNRPAIDNLKTAFGNVKDAISNAFSGDSSGFITKLADTIVPLACNALSTLMNTASGVANFFVNNFDSIKPILKGVLSGFLAYKSMSGINNVFNTVKGSINGLKGAFKAAKSATGIIKSVKTFGTALSGIKGIIGGVGSAITFLTSPVGLIVVAIGAAIAIGVALYKNWDTIKAKAQDLYNAIATKFPAIGKVFGAVKDTVSEKLSNIKQAYEEHGGGLKGIAFGALEAVKGYYTAGFTFIDKLTGGKLSAITSKIGEKFEGIKNIAGTVFGAVKDTVSEKLSNIKQAYEEHGGGLKGIAFGALEAVKGYYTAGFTFIDKLTGGKLSAITSKIEEKFAGVKDVAGKAFGALKDTVSEKLSNIKQAYEEHGGSLMGISAGIWEGIKGYYTVGYDFINNLTHGKLESIKTSITSKMSTIKNAIGNKWDEIKTGAAEKWESIKSTIYNKASGIWSSISGVFDNIKNGIVDKIQWAKDKVAGIVQGFKDLFNFEWKLPKLKIPSIEKTGAKNIMGFEVPTFGIKWNAKGGILTKPTIFGQSGNTLLGGGEAGAEAVLPLTQFWNKLRTFVNENKEQSPTVIHKHENQINIHVYATDKSADEIVHEIVPKLKLAIENM